MIKEFVAKHPHAEAFTPLRQKCYLSDLKYFDGVDGNSFSSIAEVHSFRKETSISIVNEVELKQILLSIARQQRKALSRLFKKCLASSSQSLLEKSSIQMVMG
jgi:hypothetical protein